MMVTLIEIISIIYWRIKIWRIIFWNLCFCVVEMLSGWWKVTDVDELRSIEKACHSRGIREKQLQKQLQKHMVYIGQVCSRTRDGRCTLCLFKHGLKHFEDSALSLHSVFSDRDRRLWAGGESGLGGHRSELVCGRTGHGPGHRCPATGGGTGTQSHLGQSAG